MMAGLALAVPAGAQQDPQPMTFFVTSEGLGDGANLGGLEGADAHCQSLAAAVGRGDVTWRELGGRGAGGGARRAGAAAAVSSASAAHGRGDNGRRG